MMSKDSLLLTITDVNDFLLDDDRCTKEQRTEVLKTISNIEETNGRKWLFYHDWKQYIIDEYNEYSDFIKSYTFKL
jgi:hypothetical protein